MKPKPSKYLDIKTRFDGMYKGNNEIDLFILTKILGWKVGENKHPPSPACGGMYLYPKRISATSRGCWLYKDGHYDGFSPSRNLNDAMTVLMKFLVPLGNRDIKEKFVLDGLGYRCCKHDKDGLHGRWRCYLATAWEIDGQNPLIYSTADTPAMAISKAVVQIWTWLKRKHKV